MQNRVDRAFGQVERVATALAQGLDDGVTVQGARSENGEDEKIEVAFEGLSLHA